MVNAIIDNIKVEVPENTTILEAAKQVGVKIPTLCYWEGLNEIGACRVCVVEVEGYDRLFTACNNCVEEGMVIHTDSRRAQEARRNNVQLISSCFVPKAGWISCGVLVCFKIIINCTVYDSCTDTFFEIELIKSFTIFSVCFAYLPAKRFHCPVFSS